MSAIRMDNKLKTAALRHDMKSVGTLTVEAGAAFAARDQAREVIRQHRIGAHGAGRAK